MDKKPQRVELDGEGFMRLVGAILRENTAAICRYAGVVYNDNRDYRFLGAQAANNGRQLSEAELKRLYDEAEEDKRWIKRHGVFYLMGMPPEAVIREAEIVGRLTVDHNYQILREKLTTKIQMEHITLDELTTELGITDTELAEWLRRPYNDRYRAIKQAIKALRAPVKHRKGRHKKEV